MIIKLSIPSYWGAGQRLDQFLPRDGLIDGHRVVIDKNLREADAWVVIDDLDPDDASCRVPGNKLILVTAEQVFPEDYYLEQSKVDFTRQFSFVASPYPIDHPKSVVAPPFLPWMINGGGGFEKHWRDFEHLSGTAPEPNKAGVSVVCSAKTISPGHAVRLHFVRRLHQYFGKNLTWFGSGINPIEEKWDALAPFLGSIAIENRIAPDIYSEKLIDPILAHTVPLYAGATNVQQYFPLPHKWLIDLRDFQAATKKISNVLDHGVSEIDHESLTELRELALGRNHFLSRIVSLTHATGDPSSRELKTPRPIIKKETNGAKKILSAARAILRPQPNLQRRT